MCTNQFYTEPLQIIYTNVRGKDGSYKMQLSTLSHSSIALPGGEPETRMRWSSGDPELDEKSLTGLYGETFEFDMIDLSNG